MVEGKVVEDATSAIDRAIEFLDSMILDLQTSVTSKQSSPGPPVLEAKVFRTNAEAVPSTLPLESAKLTAEQQEVGTGSVLDRQGKKPLKLPGATSDKPSKPSTSEKPSKPSASEKLEDQQENFEKAHLQVGLVHSVKDHPISEKLYVCEVQVATNEYRQVVAGLKKFISASELEGKKVALVLNLKPAKLAGQLSEAMILAGDNLDSVKVLEPPSDSAIGDRIYLEGRTPSASPVKQLSSKIWERVVALLMVEGEVATFNKTPLVTSSGAIKVPTLPNGSGIH